MIKKIQINQIKQNPENPRYIFNENDLNALAETIKTQGIIHPIEIDENNMIICGERRWRASKIAGLKEILCSITKGLTPYQKLQRQYIENAQHKDLNIMEKGRAFKNLLKYKKKELLENRDNSHKSDYHSRGIKELANQLGESPWIIRESICLVEEKKSITNAIEKEQIAYTLIIQANRIQDEKIKEKIKEKILNNDFETREILKETVNILNECPDCVEDILSKQGEDLKEIIEKYKDNQLIIKQDLEKTILKQAMPFIEKEYKQFQSTNLAEFIDYLKILSK